MIVVAAHMKYLHLTDRDCDAEMFQVFINPSFDKEEKENNDSMIL